MVLHCSLGLDKPLVCLWCCCCLSKEHIAVLYWCIIMWHCRCIHALVHARTVSLQLLHVTLGMVITLWNTESLHTLVLVLHRPSPLYGIVLALMQNRIVLQGPGHVLVVLSRTYEQSCILSVTVSMLHRSYRGSRRASV
jgi:hypothetical protein